MKTPHKHAELIKAWADGAEIEWAPNVNGKWFSAPNPSWKESYYRIKPDPKPDVSLRYELTLNGHFLRPEDSHLGIANCILTFDGTTNKLIKAEVI